MCQVATEVVVVALCQRVFLHYFCWWTSEEHRIAVGVNPRRPANLAEAMNMYDVSEAVIALYVALGGGAEQ